MPGSLFGLAAFGVMLAVSSQPQTTPAKLHCQVLNQAGMGIHGATIEVGVLGPGGWIELAEEPTDRAGECDLAFPGAAPTLLQLKVKAAGYQDAETLYLPRAKEVIPWLAVTLKGARSLEGRVVTEDHKGVGGATVVLDGPGGTLHTDTLADGSFWFDNLIPSKATLVVQVPGVGMGLYRVDLRKGPTKPVEIMLHAQRQVTLRVVDAADKPLPAIMVEVLSPQMANATTDAEGKIQINGVGAGRAKVAVALHDDFYRLQQEAVGLDVEAGSEPVELEVTAIHGGLLEGQVVDQEDGESIPAAVVWLVADGKFGPNITCDGDGKFRFEAIPEDDYLVAAGHATYGFQVAVASVQAGKKTSLKFTLPNGASIQGTVVDPAGKPVPRAIVRAVTWVPKELAGQTPAEQVGPLQIPWRAVRANADGEYLLENLPAGMIHLAATDGDGRQGVEFDVEVLGDSGVMTRKIHLGTGKVGPPM